jgi:hypothetical protein
MTKKDIIFLLAPSVLFTWMAVLALIYASALRPDPQRQQRTQKNIDELVRRAQNGEFGTEKLVSGVSDAWRERDVLHETVAGFHASLSRRVGYGVLCGVVAQIYVVFRFKAGLRKRHA